MDASRHGRALEQDARVARVEFACYAPLGFGEEVVVCGDAPVLGNGDVGRGVALRTSAATYPVWTTSEPVAVFAGVVRIPLALTEAFESFVLVRHSTPPRPCGKPSWSRSSRAPPTQTTWSPWTTPRRRSRGWNTTSFMYREIRPSGVRNMMLEVWANSPDTSS